MRKSAVALASGVLGGGGVATGVDVCTTGAFATGACGNAGAASGVPLSVDCGVNAAKFWLGGGGACTVAFTLADGRGAGAAKVPGVDVRAGTDCDGLVGANVAVSRVDKVDVHPLTARTDAVQSSVTATMRRLAACLTVDSLINPL
ncbi:MAG: hypothetical protein AAF940_10315 [Pseudomonadota bacterium]